MGKLGAWVKASRFPAQAFITPGLLFGQALHYGATGGFNWTMFGLIHLYGLCMHLFIVFANDYADYETDRLNQTYSVFTGSSRVLVKGCLSRKNLLAGAWLMAGLCLWTGALISFYQRSWFVFLLVGAGLLLLYAYSYRPVQLSYRGFGEVLQMIGVGVVLPLVGYLSQGGSMAVFPWLLIGVLLPAQLAMAIATALPDEPSDRLSRKKTSVVLLGAAQAKGLMLFLYVLSLVLIASSQTVYFAHLPGQLLMIMLAALIASQLVIVLFYPARPGSSTLVSLVFLSILTNTLLVQGLSYFIFMQS